MIQYENSSFGFRNLLRVHGSPVYKVAFPTLISTGFLLLVDYWRKDDDYRPIQHPYAVGAFMGFFSFLLTFRLNFAYQRYWEGATAVHQMMSKWIDVAMLLAAFHYQADSFKDVQPPSFGDHPTALAVDIQRRRVQQHIPSLEETLDQVQTLQQQQQQQEHQQQHPTATRGVWNGLRRRRRPQPTRCNNHDSNASTTRSLDINSHTVVEPKSINRTASGYDSETASTRIPIPLRFQERFQKASASVQTTAQAKTSSSSSTLPMATSSVITSTNNNSNHANSHVVVPVTDSERDRIVLQTTHVQMPVPSLFFQELAHLVSLTTGVAMSTLRNHIEGFEAPIVEYIPGKPWPPVDPDKVLFQQHEEEQYVGSGIRFWQSVYFIFGLAQSERHRALYNAARPFTVLGGVSDEEVWKLNRARGPYAKVALCTFWLKEFISRELMNGSVGKVHHALLSRLYQYASDGCVGYNQARKIAYIPFPFPHGQIAAVFTLVILFIFPVLFQSYINELWFACFLNTLTVLCFLGLHEVARELENPFQNIPNDLPLTNFQAQINEALVTMYAGYHPDAHWSIVMTEKKNSNNSEEEIAK